MNMKNKKVWVIVGGVVLVAAGCLLLLGDRATATEKPEAASAEEGGRGGGDLAQMRQVVGSRKRTETPDAAGNRKADKQRKGARPEQSLFDHLPKEERALCEAVQDALDAEDLERTLAAAAQAMRSENPEVRSHVVDALSWFGADALPELTIMMGDKDEDVAQSAINAWELGLDEIDEAAIRLNVSGMALRAVHGEDALESIRSRFANAATEMIDAEEEETAASAVRVKVIQTVVDMIGSQQQSLSEAGRELYEEITGNEWRGFDEAERYLKDPDDYELPEDRESESEEADVQPNS